MKNRRCIFFFLLVFLSIWSKNTFAQLAFRNNCNTQISLAIKYIPFPNSPYWVTSGWWNIQPGYTQTVLTGSLINRYFYFYAKSSDGFVWSGYTNTCINDNGFERREYNNQNACLMGDYSVPFQQIDVGSYTDYIFPLNCPGSEYRATYKAPYQPKNNSQSSSVSKNPKSKTSTTSKKKSKANNDETFAYFKESKFKNEIIYNGACGFFGSQAYLKNRDSNNSYRVTVRTTTDEYKSGSSDWKYIVYAGEKVSIGCTRGDGAGARKYYYEIVGEEKWNK